MLTETRTYDVLAQTLAADHKRLLTTLSHDCEFLSHEHSAIDMFCLHGQGAVDSQRLTEHLHTQMN